MSSKHKSPSEIMGAQNNQTKPSQIVFGLPIQPDPVPAESKEIHPVESSPAEKSQDAAEQKKSGGMMFMPSLRPQPPQKMKKDGSTIVAEVMAPQMGTSPELMSMMRIDELKWAVTKEAEVPALAHFSFRFVHHGVRYFGHIVDFQLRGSQGVGGTARKHALQLMANSSGSAMIEKAQKPNVVARTLWNRNWRQKAEAEGKVVEE